MDGRAFLAQIDSPLALAASLLVIIEKRFFLYLMAQFTSSSIGSKDVLSNHGLMGMEWDGGQSRVGLRHRKGAGAQCSARAPPPPAREPPRRSQQMPQGWGQAEVRA